MLELTCHQIPSQIPDGEKSFTDYPRSSNYNEQTLPVLLALYTAVDEGIISGYPDKTLKPFEPVNYAEASKIVYMSINISEEQSASSLSRITYNFFGTEWYIKYYIFMADLTGRFDLDPAANISAADAEKITNYLMEKYPA